MNEIECVDQASDKFALIQGDQLVGFWSVIFRRSVFFLFCTVNFLVVTQIEMVFLSIKLMNQITMLVLILRILWVNARSIMIIFLNQLLIPCFLNLNSSCMMAIVLHILYHIDLDSKIRRPGGGSSSLKSLICSYVFVF